MPLPAVFQDTRRVVIVGGGFAGAAVATHLLRRADSSLSVTIVEPGPWIGRGVAYGVESHVFRLNVPAAKMSIDPEQPDDFATWAAAAPDAFLPRARYGAYVVERLAQAVRASSAALRVVSGEVVRVMRGAVILSNDQELPADAVVLATGVRARARPSSLPDDERIVDGWDEPALAGLPKSGHVLLLGAGLTALDVIAFLDASVFPGRVTVVSRRGLLPRPHVSPLTPAASLPAELCTDLPGDLRGLLKWGRDETKRAETRGEPWQHAIDEIRAHAATLWRRMPAADRVRFVRRVRPFWDVMRHRAPVDSLTAVAAWQATGKLEIVAGCLVACDNAGLDGLEVELRLAGGRVRRERYDAIVRCMGPAMQRGDFETPLIHDLVASGRASVDPAGLGIVTDEEGRVVAANGEADPTLLAIGAVRRASSWETTSVPDISVHAWQLAKRLVP